MSFQFSWVYTWASLVAQMVVKNLPAMQETQVQSLSQEDPLEKGMATHYSILAWRIPWTDSTGHIPRSRISGLYNNYLAFFSPNFIYLFLSVLYLHCRAGLSLVAAVCCAQSCLTLCDPMDWSPPGSSVHGILQARILEWGATPSSRGSSQSRNQTCISCIFCMAGKFFTAEPLGKPLFSFLRSHQIVFCSDFTILHSHQLAGRFPVSPHPSQCLLFSFCLIL